MKEKSKVRIPIGRYISRKKGVLGGTPCIKGTRIPIALVVKLLGRGETLEDINKHYPYVSVETLREVLSELARMIARD